MGWLWQFLCYLQLGMTGLKHFFRPYPIDTRALSIHGIGIQEKIRPSLVNRPRGTGDYLLMHFYQPCFVRDRAGESPREPHSFVVWGPSTSHWYGNPRSAWSHSWLHADGFKLQRWLKAAHIPQNTVLPLRDGMIFERHLEMLHRELTGGFAPDEKIASNLLENALREIGRTLCGGQIVPAPQWLLDIRSHLETHFTEPIRLAHLARKIHRSAPYLCEQFKRHFGMSVIDYVIRLRLQRAAYLLCDHNKSIGEIAIQVGYDDIYHFSKLFKKRYGQSPRAHRIRMTV